MSYSFYKLLHFFSIFMTLTIFSISLYAGRGKWKNIGGGIFSLLILVSGMGLLARIGVQHGSGMPTWIFLKMGFWGIITILMPIWIKRLSSKRDIGYAIMVTVAFLAAYVAINKPQTLSGLF